VSQNADKVKKAFVSRGKTPPKSAESAQVEPRFYLFWKGFTDLRAGVGPSYIPWGSIAEYARFYSIRDPEMFIRIIRRVDRWLLNEAKTEGAS
jgi:hypothetical protein